MMKQLFVFIASSVLSLTASAQQNGLVGMWQQLDSNGFPTTQVKVFMPDGKELGLSYNSDFTNSSVWFMSNYKVLNDTSYVDQAFYHSNIAYQHDYLFTFYKENDSIRFYFIGKNWQRKVEMVGRQTSFDPEGTLIV